ncbi:MAG: hypothetical protein WC823_04335 [Parcubacteria group bacterium]|jgi:hypothetical protein
MEGQVLELSQKKKWLERSLFLTIIILVILAFFVVANRSGWRVDWSVQKVNYLKYSHIGPDFSFRYPDYFHLDTDVEKRFGTDYIAGFKLRTNQGTGCDVRYNSFGLNFQKSDQEIQAAIEKDLSQTAKEFHLISSKRLQVDGEQAFLVEFDFLDPTGDTVRLAQMLTSHAGMDYALICGTGEYQYKYFQRDFADFFSNFRWVK